MPKDWIVDVLSDLKAFAERNGLSATAAGVEDAALVAIAELASLEGFESVIEPAPPHRTSGAPMNGLTGRAADNVTELFPRRNLV